MKKSVSAMLILALCLGLWGCAGNVTPTEPSTEPKVTVDPNAEPEIVVNPESVKQNPLETGDAQPVCYFRTTEGTNCGIEGVVSVEYMDENGNALYTFTPQLPGGTLSAGGYFGGNTSVTERIDNRYISYEIDTETDKLLSCEYAEINGRMSRCTRIDLYGDNGQVASSIEVSRADRDLYVHNISDMLGNAWSIISEQFLVYETDDGVATAYSDRTLYYKNAELVAEIIGDPVIGLDDGWMFCRDRKVEIRNSRGEVIGTYEPSGENSLVSAGVSTEDGFVYVEEQRYDHCYTRHEQIDVATGIVVSQKISDYSPDGALIREETTKRTTEDVVSYHCVTTYNASGQRISEEIEFWGGRVETTPHPDYTVIYIKAEFYDAEGVLQKTVEHVEGSIGFGLSFSEEGGCSINHFDENGNDVHFDYYCPVR